MYWFLVVRKVPSIWNWSHLIIMQYPSQWCITVLDTSIFYISYTVFAWIWNYDIASLMKLVLTCSYFFPYFGEEIFRSKNYFSLINPEEFSRHETFYFGSLNCKFNFYSLWRAANAVYFTASLDYLCFLKGWFILSNLLAHSCL